MRDFQYPGRSAAYGEKGMVAASHPLATQAGLDVLRAGGNAADAAIAAAAVLCVVEPQNAGIGGDTFFMHASSDGVVWAYNGSGRTPRTIDVEAIAAEGRIGLDSVNAITVPGAVDALCRLHAEKASLDLGLLLQPAISLAENGYIVLPRVGRDWKVSEARLQASACPSWLLADGIAPGVGERMKNIPLARTLREIARSGRDAFYQGPSAASMVEALRRFGGAHDLEDFADHKGESVEPIRTDYRGREILECPPNGQGITVLMLLNILSGFDIASAAKDEAGFIHLMAEANKLAYAERDAICADPDFASCPIERLLSKDHASALRARIDPARAQFPLPPDRTEHRDTVYLSVVDRDLNVMSFINSIFTDFGSALYDDGTGVLFNNRGASFSLEPGHPNRLAPRKRPMHTIIPGLALKDGRPEIGFGVMGGHYQAMGQAHFLMNVLDLGLDPQEAMEVPRSFGYGRELQLERPISQAVAAALQARGHVITRPDAPIGGGQAVIIDHRRGLMIGGSDPRKDGYAGAAD